MLSIQLHRLQFRANHGLYEEEKINGNDFEVNVTINYHPQKIIQSINESINYEEVYKLIEDRMQIATPLLETVAMDIAQKILQQFSLAEEVKISVTKLNPPIKNIKGNVGVSFELKRTSPLSGQADK